MITQNPSTLIQVVNLLNDGQIRSGSDIGEKLGISRTAVWKVIHRLKNYKVQIDAEAKGYRLETPLSLLESLKVMGQLKYPELKLHIFESIPSTHEALKNDTSKQNLLCYLAEHQSQGRGRLGRSWTSPFGRNISCSLSYAFQKDISELSGLSLVVGILMIQALKSLYPSLKFSLKWPNDIYLEGKKLGGILINLTAEAHGNCMAILSLGLNVNMKDFPLEGVDQAWISLENVLQKRSDRNRVAATLLNFILEGLERFHEQGMAPFLAEWEKVDFLKDQEITINTGHTLVSGIANGINEKGCLLLQLPSGAIHPCSYGDATLLKSAI